MRSTTNVFLLNLAVSDVMVGCFCMWVHLGNNITNDWPFDEFVCKGNTFMQVVAVTSSVLTLTAIAVERFFAIVFPLRKRKSPCITVVVLVTNWLVAVGIAMPHLIVRRRYEYYWKDRHQIWCEENWPKVYVNRNCSIVMPGRRIYYTLVTSVLYFIPIFVMLCAYTIIVIKMLLRKRPGTQVNSSRQLQEKSRKKVIKMLVAVLTAFIVCWTPQQAFILWDMYRPTAELGEEIPGYVMKIKYAAMYIAYLNSALNPILYGGFNENFRNGFNDAFHCLLLRRRNTVVPFLVEPKPGQSRRPQGSANTTPVHTTPVCTSTI
ncbi:neuropeptide FF receptor 2-like isoform X2 [Dreissena polymorpha]|nr:neuropeptide FF receptor 2-like isoform X2 [Dreissena polymorpha]